MKIASTTAALAAQLGTTKRTITTWLKRPDSPGRTATGGFNVARWKAWLASTGLGTRTTAAESNPRLLELKREKLVMQCELIGLQSESIALKNALARGDSVKLDDARRILGNAWMAMITRLRSTKHRISQQVCGLDSGAAEKILSEDIKETMRQVQLPEGYGRDPFWSKIREVIAKTHAAHWGGKQ